MSFAVIQTGGKQYLVAKGDKIQVEKLNGEVGESITFNEVLAIFSDADYQVGSPLLAGKQVEGKIIDQGKGKKIHVLKYRPKSKYRRKIGHRQEFTEVEITNL